MWSKPMWLFVISIPPEAVQSVLCNSPCSWGECKKHMEFAANGLSCVTLKKFINLSESQFFLSKNWYLFMSRLVFNFFNKMR